MCYHGKFTHKAASLWATIPVEVQEGILSSAWCSECVTDVRIINFSGNVLYGEVILIGWCVMCHHNIVRVVETSETRIENNCR
jgi:hypothetical protein